jgi:hypothetical protein
MALLNKAWREGEFVPPGAEPGLTEGSSWRDAVELRAVTQIAATRFNFPSAGDPDLRTAVNIPERQLGVRGSSGDLLFPDIVVMDTRTTEVRMVAEVETVRSLHDAPDLPEKWQAFLSVSPFYLFVPMSEIEATRARLKLARLKPTGLRAWRHMAGLDFTDVVDVRL